MYIKTLENISIEKITDTFNLAFSDYFISFHMTPELLSSKMKADKTDLSYSVGVFEDEELIALILHGTDIIGNKRVVYNGGTGVIPSKRGMGLTRRMYEFILPVLKEKGVDNVVLEVISKNIQAIKSYERSGFEIVRELKCYKGQISLKERTENFIIKELISYDWTIMQSFWDLMPTWQNSSHVADELKNINRALGAYINNELVGYVIYNPNSKRIQQIAVHKDFRKKGIGSALMAVVVEEIGKELSIINIDKDSIPINSFLLRIGLENNINQFEMKLKFNNDK